MADLCARLHAVAMTLFIGFAKSFEVQESTFETYHAFDEPSGSVLRYVHNPPGLNNPTSPYPSLFEHTDNGTLTVLFSGLGGLQVLPAGSDDVPSAWRWVQPEPGYAIVNLGDPVVQWTGGILRSNYHRVMPASGEQARVDRCTFEYFLKPADDVSMRRLQEGSVIPRLTKQEVEEDRTHTETYEMYHRRKTIGYRTSENQVKSRGGLGAKLKTMKVKAQQ